MKIPVRKIMTLKLSKGNKIRLQQLVVGGSAGHRFGDLLNFFFIITQVKPFLYCSGSDVFTSDGG